MVAAGLGAARPGRVGEVGGVAGVEGGEAADQQQQGGTSHTAQSELVVITLHYQLSPVTFTGLLLVFSYCSYFKKIIFFHIYILYFILEERHNH